MEPVIRISEIEQFLERNKQWVTCAPFEFRKGYEFAMYELSMLCVKAIKEAPNAND